MRYVDYETLSVIKDNSKFLSPKTGRLKVIFTKMENSGKHRLRAEKSRH